MKKLCIVLIIIAAAFLVWKYVITDEAENDIQIDQTVEDGDEVIFDEALQDLEGARESLPSR